MPSCFIPEALDMDFRITGVNLFYLGKLEGKKVSIMIITLLGFRSRLTRAIGNWQICTNFFVYYAGGVDSFMTRIDMAVITATSIPDLSLNSEVCGMKLCRLLRLKKVLIKMWEVSWNQESVSTLNWHWHVSCAGTNQTKDQTINTIITIGLVVYPSYF